MEKINVAELLKDCPKGMELDCAIYEDVYFDGIDEVCDIIKCYIQEPKHKIGISFNKYGHYSNTNKSKCVIFPKGKTTWEGFVPPCKFKDGDVIYAKSKSILNTELVGIYKKEDNERIYDYCSVSLSRESFYHHNVYGLIHKSIIDISRLATEEEKQKLFDAIKKNGYKWNEETKTLENLIESKEDTDDKIVMSGIYFDSENYADEVELHLGNYEIEIRDGKTYAVFKNQKTNTFEKFPKFKVGDRVRNKNYKDYIYTIHDIVDKGYIAKEIDADYPIIILFGSQEDNYELVPNKFDITTLKPFDKVLVRCGNNGSWAPQFFAKYRLNSKFPFECTYNSWSQCIPYEGNEHLSGTTDDCDEYYKTWENLCLKI